MQICKYAMITNIFQYSMIIDIKFTVKQQSIRQPFQIKVTYHPSKDFLGEVHVEGSLFECYLRWEGSMLSFWHGLTHKVLVFPVVREVHAIHKSKWAKTKVIEEPELRCKGISILLHQFKMNLTVISEDSGISNSQKVNFIYCVFPFFSNIFEPLTTTPFAAFQTPSRHAV